MGSVNKSEFEYYAYGILFVHLVIEIEITRIIFIVLNVSTTKKIQ